jgi:hypothetical protein
MNNTAGTSKAIVIPVNQQADSASRMAVQNYGPFGCQYLRETNLNF